jgi:hypothetical protein
MAAGVPVLVVPVVVGVLVHVSLGIMNVLMAVVGMRLRVVAVLMFMLVFIVAAHLPYLLVSF